MDTATARTRRRATRPAGKPGDGIPGDGIPEPTATERASTPVDVDTDAVSTAVHVDTDAVSTSAVPATAEDAPRAPRRPRLGRRGLAWTAFVLVLLVLGGAAGWLLVTDQRAAQDADLRDRLLAGARQTALNMTTLQADSAQSDVDRLLAGASGDFLAQFQDRRSDFVDVVGQAGVNSTGTVVSAGIESTDGNCAVALVAADAEVSNVDQEVPTPRSFRFRIAMCERDGAVTADNVEFVP